jgi:hypothetical protein
LLADDSSNTLGDRVRLANLAALGNLNALGVALFAALRFANGTCAALRNHFANFVVTNLGTTLRNHFAGGVVTSLATLLANHTAGPVVTGLATLFANHTASRVVHNLAAVFANGAANFVVANLGAALRNHFANGVIANLGATLGNHSARGAGNHFALAFRNSVTDRVWALTSAAFTTVTSLANFLLLTSRNPDLLADGLWATLDALGAALAWAVNLLASRSIVRPSTWLTNCTTHHTTRNCFLTSFPMSTTNRNGLGVLLRNTHTVFRGANFGFAYSVVNRVVDRTRLGFVDGLHHCVVDGAATSFADGHIDRVVDRARLGLVHRLTNGVVDRSLMSFVHRLFDCVVDHSRVCLVHRLFDCVVDGSAVSFVNRLVYGVIDRS